MGVAVVLGSCVFWPVLMLHGWFSGVGLGGVSVHSLGLLARRLSWVLLLVSGVDWVKG